MGWQRESNSPFPSLLEGSSNREIGYRGMLCVGLNFGLRKRKLSKCILQTNLNYMFS